jgi:ketol-acid reductoisomerase
VRVLKSTGAPNYKQVLDGELNELGNSEMWRAGAAVRKLRPLK